ncbi:hypothetical protein V2J09_018752 [Rumex salicifolius]
MPRPGPRPYECVRRAWHSDRHQPMRGSIISQSFRVVTEAHSPVTRKNREWQEKLPIVVIKAEEIMYSKANSEAEYLDPDTLWDRLNDAIDTIIRKEEDAETGEHLQPCIEAALVLGCVPVRASRSQRLSNPRSYLQPRVQESTPRVVPLSDKTAHESQPLHHNLVAPINQFSITRLPVGSQPNAAPILDNRTTWNVAHNPVNNISSYSPNMERNILPTCATDTNQLRKAGSVYPLYYGADCQNLNSRTGIHLPQNQNIGNVIIGRPIGWPSAQPAHHCSTRDLFPTTGGGSGSSNPRLGSQIDSARVASAVDCDLSLRLGPTLDLLPCVERQIRCDYEAGSSGRCQEDDRDTRSSTQNQEICFFPRQTPNYPLEPCSSRWASGSEVRDMMGLIDNNQIKDPTSSSVKLDGQDPKYERRTMDASSLESLGYNCIGFFPGYSSTASK